MNLYNLLKAYGAEHGVYVCVDGSPQTPSKILMVRRDHMTTRMLDEVKDINVTLDEMLKEIERKGGTIDG